MRVPEYRIAGRRGTRRGSVAAGRRILVARSRPALETARLDRGYTTRTASSSRLQKTVITPGRSAAFMSYVMRIAGAGSRFPYSETHSDYINAARRHSLGLEPGTALSAERAELYAPQRGDLICYWRGRNRFPMTSCRPAGFRAIATSWLQSSPVISMRSAAMSTMPSR